MFVVDNLCAICQNGLEEPELLTCDHRLCRVCFTHWEATNSRCCPQCRTRLKRADEKHAEKFTQVGYSSSKSSQAVLLPGLPLPDPHAGLLVLYHGGDEAIGESSLEPGFCNLRCYIEDNSTSRRFMYCGNCDTAFHRLNYKLPASDQRGPQNIGITAPMTQMLKHPTSRTNLQNEAKHRHQRNTEIHQQLLGHAVYCQEARCGYNTCSLMKNYLGLAERHSRKRVCVDLTVSAPTHLHQHQHQLEVRARGLPGRTAVPTTRSAAASSAHTTPTTATVFTMRSTPVAVEAVPVTEEETEEAVAANELARREDDISRAVGLSRGCRYCIRAANILGLHEAVCAGVHCGVRYCADLKQQHLRTP